MGNVIVESAPLKILHLAASLKEAERTRALLTDAGYTVTMDAVVDENGYTSHLHAGSYDVILSEFKLPGFDAFGALRRAAEIRPEVPFICVAGSIQDELTFDLVKQGAFDVVQRDRMARLPFSVKRALEEAAERKSRRLAEKALHESEERFRLVFNASMDGILLTSPSGRIFAANPAMCDMVHRSEEEICSLGRNCLVDQDDPRLARALDQRLQTGRFRGELTLVRKDGSKFPAEVSTVLFKDDSGADRTSMVIRDVSDRKRAEEEVIRNETLLTTAVERLPIIFYVIDADGNFRLSIGAGLHRLGLMPNQLVGQSAFDVYKAFPVITDAIKRSLAGEHVEFESTVGEASFANFLAPFSSPKGSFAGIAGVALDITESRRIERALRNREMELLEAQKAARIGNWRLEVRTDVVTWSEELYEIFEINKSDSLGYEAFIDRVHSEDRESVLKAKASARSTGDRFDIEYRIVVPSGAVKVIREVGYGSRDEQGEVVQLIGIAQDVTEHKKEEEERERLITAIEHTAEAIYITDSRGTLQYVNPAFERITGFTREEVIGQNPRIMKSGRQDAEFYRELWTTISKGARWSGRFINRRKDGTLFTDETSISPVVNRKGQIINYVGVKRDITSELLLESQLIQAQKLESIGTLASGIAHDFNNILGIIIGHTSLLSRLREDEPHHEESAAAIMKAAQRGTSLVKQLMLFARKTEALLETVRVNDLIGEIAKLLQQTFPKTITLSLTLQRELPAILADPNQLHQVFMNLFVNARDAMPLSGGTISITTMTIGHEAVVVIFPKATAREYVKLEVSDTGMGMDETTRRRIFEPFFTTKGPDKGTGLGLAVVFGIVEHHHGFIDVRSATGEGTTFTVYLPVPARAAKESQEGVKSLAELPGGTETVLIIEDEEVLMNFAKGTLVAKGYTVLAAENGQQGVEVYRSHQEEIDVVVSDIGLPILNGYDVFRKIRSINPDAKVIFASGFFDPEAKSEMYKAGLKNFIQKPYLQNEILLKIREAIDSA